MKKRLTIYLLVCLLCLSACGRADEEPAGWTARQMAWAILNTQQGPPEAEELTWGQENFGAYLTGCYQLDPDQVEEGAILAADGVSALEIAVLRLAEGTDADTVRQALEDYIDSRTGAFTGYAPEQAAVLEGSGAVVRGRYAALLICPGQQEARDAFNACFEGAQPPAEDLLPAESSADPVQPNPTVQPDPAGQPPQDPSQPSEAAESAQKDSAPADPSDAPDAPESTPPGQVPQDPSAPAGASQDPPIPAEIPAPEPEPVPADPAPAEEPREPAREETSAPGTPAAEEIPWSYDRQRLVSAWERGDWQSGLAERDRVILQTCADVLSELLAENMTDYDKELAVHDWMLDWGSYDPEVLSARPDAQPNPDGDNPYGFLTARTGICTGYTSTFQLLMDLAGVECISVAGTSHSGTRDHAWNMVRLDGEWYCVDVTWDDPITSGPVPAAASHTYFNVTGDFMRITGHQWDEAQTPQAAAAVWSWVAQTGGEAANGTFS